MRIGLFPAESSATFSADRKYRYLLQREWSSSPLCVFIMLNPSTADEIDNDPTIRRCIGFVKQWGYGSLSVLNLFAYRSTDPLELEKVPDPVGALNDQYLIEHTTKAAHCIAAWGVHGILFRRDLAVLKLLPKGKIKCLGTTKAGQPKHPLYLMSETMWSNYY